MQKMAVETGSQKVGQHLIFFLQQTFIFIHTPFQIIGSSFQKFQKTRKSKMKRSKKDHHKISDVSWGTCKFISFVLQSQLERKPHKFDKNTEAILHVLNSILPQHFNSRTVFQDTQFLLSK